MDPRDVVIPGELRPSDGRFGAGPSRVRPEAVSALTEVAPRYLGTSHRQGPVKDMVARLRRGLRELFALPEGYEVVLGNGGATSFWDAACFGLVREKSQHLVFGEFSARFAAAAEAAPHLSGPHIVRSDPGSHPSPVPAPDVDLYALTHNETSTGVAAPVERVEGGGLTVVDGTSAAGGMLFEPSELDTYYFAPQKGFASDGGLWLALLSPAALGRIEEIKTTGRYIPPSLDLSIAVESSRKEQTYNTPPLVTIFLMVHHLEWFLGNGGLRWCAARSAASAEILYGWAERSGYATPFVADEEMRSPVVGTIDLADHIDAGAVTKALRANGIVDTEPYRKLGRNQLRVGMYPAVDPEDVRLLTSAIDYVVRALHPPH